MRSSSALVTPWGTAARLREATVAAAATEVTAAVRRNVRREVFMGSGRMGVAAREATRECGEGSRRRGRARRALYFRAFCETVSPMVDTTPPNTADAGLEVRTYFVRNRNVLLARADFGELFVDYYLHLSANRVAVAPAHDALFKRALAAFT